MAKSTKKIIIFAAVILLLIAGIVAVNVADFSSGDESPATAEPTYTVFSADISDISSVSAGEVQAVRADGKWTIYGMDKDDVDGSKAETFVNTVAVITSKNKIEENVTDFAQYGLDSPRLTVIINVKGVENILQIGDKSPTLGEYFIRMNGGAAVYTLPSYKVDTLMKPLSYYSEFNRFSVNIDDITEIKIERADETVELRIAEDISSTTNNVWEMVSPYESSANDEYIDSSILPAIEKLSLNVPAAGGAHGTDKPSAKITLTVKPYDNVNGKYGEKYAELLTVGDVEESKAYVGYKGKVYETDAESVGFANASAFNIINKLQALVDISRVKAFAVTANGRTDKVRISRSGNDMSFNVNGSAADEKTAKSIYQAMISLAVDGVYKGETLGETVVCIDFEGVKAADSVKIEFKSINELSCALVRNDKTEFTIKKNKINEFIELWKAYVDENGGN